MMECTQHTTVEHTPTSYCQSQILNNEYWQNLCNLIDQHMIKSHTEWERERILSARSHTHRNNWQALNSGFFIDFPFTLWNMTNVCRIPFFYFSFLIHQLHRQPSHTHTTTQNTGNPELNICQFVCAWKWNYLDILWHLFVLQYPKPLWHCHCLPSLVRRFGFAFYVFGCVSYAYSTKTLPATQIWREGNSRFCFVGRRSRRFYAVKV